MKVKILETESIEYKGAINQVIKESGDEMTAYLIHIETTTSDARVGYVYYENGGKIIPIPLEHIRVIDENVDSEVTNNSDNISSIFDKWNSWKR